MRIPKEWFKVADENGWTIRIAKRGGHWHWRSPTGALVVTAYSPSDRRGILNDRSRLRRAGLPV